MMDTEIEIFFFFKGMKKSRHILLSPDILPIVATNLETDEILISIFKKIIQNVLVLRCHTL